MDKPALYSRRPILSAPLRWRVELAVLCLILAILGLFALWQPITGLIYYLAVPALILAIPAICVTLYPHFEDADQSVLQPSRPRLNRAIGLPCIIGVLVLGTIQFLTHNHSLFVSSFAFLQGFMLSTVFGTSRRERAGPATSAQP